MAASDPAATRGNIESVQPSPEQILLQLDRILKSSVFVRSERLRRFLRVTVELALAGNAESIKEYMLGRDVFDRGKNYDPRVDSIVRVEARRLRKKLHEYYQQLGAADPISIEFPPGSYVPAIRWRGAAAPRPTPLVALTEARPLNPLTVAVLPFVNLSPDPDQDFFCDGITEEILNTLSTVPQLNVVARTSVFRFKGKTADVREIGKQLHAGTVIEGSVRKADNTLRISAQVIDAIQGVLLWSGTFDRELTDVFAVQDEIAQAIADSLHVTLAAHAHEASLFERKHFEAYTLLLKGRHFWNQLSQDGTQAALAEFEHAISLDPDFAPAYAALADALTKITFWGAVPPSEGFSRARQAALEGIRLDPQAGDAYALLGVIACCYDWNWDEGARLLKRAVELQPSSMNALGYDALRLVFLGEFEAARPRIERWCELDPVSPWSFRNQGWYYYFQGEYDRAAEAMKSALALDPDFREGQLLLAWAYLRNKRFEEAIAHLDALPEGPFSSTKWGALGEAYACSGDASRALDALAKIDAMGSGGYVSPINRAWILAGLGDWTRVFEQLEQSYQQHVPWLSALKVDPRYNAVRSDPRMTDLLSRMNIS